MANTDIHVVKKVLKGQWITDKSNQVMLDPQTSALKLWRGKLLSISDGSAHQSQQKKLHVIQPSSAKLLNNGLAISLAVQLENSCFANYLSNSPDLEALAIDPSNDNVMYVVTEDARQGGELSEACQQRFKNTGSTDFPSLLVRLEIEDNNHVLMTHVRPLQFDAAFAVGNYANDGIEGMTFGADRTLYLALEKDIQGKARIFSVNMGVDFWSVDGFFKVKDTQFTTPSFTRGDHPINALDYYPGKNDHGFLIAAARNDHQLWIIDIEKKQTTRIISLEFMAPVRHKNKNCKPFEQMDNASIEGIGIGANNVWLVNDPWKKNYLKNIQCSSNSEAYKQMAPLLFKLPIDANWFN